MRTYLLILSSLLLIIVVGCKKKEDVLPEVKPVVKPIVKLVSQISGFNGTTTDVTVFKYDDKNRLISDLTV